MLFVRWAATTGRSSSISDAYLSQCNMLLNISEATLQDNMVVAEVLLYKNLHELTNRHDRVDTFEESKELVSWKQKWSHLFGN
jgi:hypothetical protein